MMSLTKSHSISLKHCLILLTLISVVADTMVLPFYPQFFAEAFAMHSPEHVGYYIAACCLTVMLAFPFWARVARRVNELHLWVYTQIAAGSLGFYCFFAADLLEFWIASLLMLVFKASYLLIYPFVMRLEEKDKHLGVAGLFSVLMHFGGIGGALIGGFILNWYSARDLYLVMPLSDVMQVLLCLYLIRRQKIAAFNSEAGFQNIGRPHPLTFLRRLVENAYVWKIGIASALFYFSSFLIRPFFTRYWEQLSGWNNEAATGLIYSIPAWVALACLWLEHRRGKQACNVRAIIHASLIGLLGLYLQSAGNLWLVIIGRCVFGYAIYQITVRQEVLLFQLSEPSRYASDFSKLHFFQNLGVIAASFCVGYLASHFSMQMPFYVAVAGLLVSLLFFLRVSRSLVVPSTLPTSATHAQLES